MAAKFWICQTGRRSRWIVRLEDRIYGDYLDRQQATLDAP